MFELPDAGVRDLKPKKSDKSGGISKLKTDINQITDAKTKSAMKQIFKLLTNEDA